VSISGLRPQPEAKDLTQTPSWRLKSREAGNGATVVTRTYGAGGIRRSVRVVAARTDLAGKLDISMAADKGHDQGRDHCTQNVVLVPGTKPRVRPTVMLCWRTAKTFSAYSLTIDPDSTRVSASDGAAALDTVWNAALKEA
jgi:hypothetical protein